MLSINHPNVLDHIRQLSYGLMPIFFVQEEKFGLVIKACKEAILAARLNNQIKIYLVPNDAGRGSSYIGFITAFFDDHDEPMVLKSPQYLGDQLLDDLTRLFSQDVFDIFFFDEHSRELMGVRVNNVDALRFRQEIAEATFPEFDHSKSKEAIDALDLKFSIRSHFDDERSFILEFADRLYPDDFIMFDARGIDAFNVLPGNIFSVTELEREDPGPYQERDIALLMSRIFDGDSIYLNPFRDDTGKELADILVVTDDVMLFVQAKDSPNTEAALRRSIGRKRSAIRSHIEKAVKQLKGALTYALDNGGVVLKSSSGPRTIEIGDRQLVGLIVVRELFDDDYIGCSATVLNLGWEISHPVVLFDYPGLHVITQNVGSPGRLINGFFDMLDMALERGQFPKPVWSGPPAKLGE